jgi:cytochrome b561
MAEQQVLDAARVIAGDDRVRYDRPSMALHWATAILVVTLWLLAQAWGFFPHGSPIPPPLRSLHVSIGLVLILVLSARIGWRIGPARRVPPADTGWMEFAARGVHYLLYALLACAVILGLFNRWLHGEPMTFFWLFTIPSPVAKSKALASTVNGVHGWIGHTILILAALHALAALFHRFVLRDDVLLRMLPGRRAEAASPAGAPAQR